MRRELDVLTINGIKRMPFEANGTTKVRYRQVFHRDLEVDLTKLSKVMAGAEDETADSLTLDRLAFIMHAAGERQDMSTLSEDDFYAFLEGLEAAWVANIANEIVEIYNANQKTTSTGKK